MKTVRLPPVGPVVLAPRGAAGGLIFCRTVDDGDSSMQVRLRGARRCLSVTVTLDETASADETATVLHNGTQVAEVHVASGTDWADLPVDIGFERGDKIETTLSQPGVIELELG